MEERRLTEATKDRLQLTSSAFDANGNTLSDAKGRSFTWDFENRLASAVVPGTGTVNFKYDPFGRRVQKSGPLGTANYLYDGFNPLAEVDQSGNVLARYTQTTRIDEPLAELRSATTSYYDADALGSITALTNSAGSLVNTYSYDSFGKLLSSTGTLTNPFQYTGREFDQETGIYQYRARYFDQSIGRFVSEDPVGFWGGANFYAYVGNRAPNAFDPLGLCKERCLQEANRRFIQSTQQGSAWQTFTQAQPSVPKTLFTWGVGGARNWNWSPQGLAWSYYLNVLWNGGAEAVDYWRHWYDANEQYERDVEACESQ
jgi:RHS repeat-associated protein